MIENNYSLIGYLAALLTTFSIIPQIIRVYRLKESRDISLWTVSALSAGILLWVIHGIVIGDLPVILANGISLGLSFLMLGLVVKYRSIKLLTTHSGQYYEHFQNQTPISLRF